MIDMKFAHRMARHTLKWTIGVSYREALRSAMVSLWGQFKKANTTPEQAINTLTEKELVNALYEGYKVEGYCIDDAAMYSKKVAKDAKAGQWHSLATRFLKAAGWGSAL